MFFFFVRDVLKITLDMPNLDCSSFSISNYFAFSYTFRLCIDEHHRCVFFSKNSYVDVNYKIQVKFMLMHIFSYVYHATL